MAEPIRVGSGYIHTRLNPPPSAHSIADEGENGNAVRSEHLMVLLCLSWEPDNRCLRSCVLRLRLSRVAIALGRVTGLGIADRPWKAFRWGALLTLKLHRPRTCHSSPQPKQDRTEQDKIQPQATPAAK
jgi:hypothetical protein